MEVDDEFISFANFIIGLRCLSRSKDEELDHYIYKLFDLCGLELGITTSQMVMMLMSLPDVGFGYNSNTVHNNPQYANVRDQVLQ